MANKKGCYFHASLLLSALEKLQENITFKGSFTIFTVCMEIMFQKPYHSLQ